MVPNQARGKQDEKCAFFGREGEREISLLGGIEEHGVAKRVPKGKPLHALEAWLKGWKLWLRVCIRSFTLEAFHESLKSFLPKLTH